MHALQFWTSARYKRIGDDTNDYINGEDGAVGLLQAAACGRIKRLFDTQKIPYNFSIHPSRRPPDSQVTKNHSSCMQKQCLKLGWTQ